MDGPTRQRIDTGSPAFARTLTVLAIVILITAFAISAAALVEVAAWANVHPALRWGIAIVIDASALMLIGHALRSRSEGRHRRATGSWIGVGTITLISAGLNAAHAADGPATGWRLDAGMVMAALPPLLVWLAIHILAQVHFATPEELDARAEGAERAADREAERQERAAEKAAQRDEEAAEKAAKREERAALREARHQAKLARIAAEVSAETAEIQATLAGKVATVEANARRVIHDAEAAAPDSPAPAPVAAPEPSAPVRATPARHEAPTAVLAPSSADKDSLRVQALALAATGLSAKAIAAEEGMPSRQTVDRWIRAARTAGELVESPAAAPAVLAELDLEMAS